MVNGQILNTNVGVVLYLYDEPPISGEIIIIRTISVLILVSHVNGIGNMVPHPFLQKKKINFCSNFGFGYEENQSPFPLVLTNLDRN